MNCYVLYNPLAGSGWNDKEAERLSRLLHSEEIKYRDITEIRDYEPVFSTLKPTDTLVVCGGDGTLHRFINQTEGIRPANEILYYATGNHNNFLCNLGLSKGGCIQKIRPYLRGLPTVTIGESRMLFLNDVCYGVNPYEKTPQDMKRRKRFAAPSEAVMQQFLYSFHPEEVTITVDGKAQTFPDTWMVAVLNGRFCGDGLRAAPQNNRIRTEQRISAVVLFGCGRLKALQVYPSMYRGKHLSDSKACQLLTGRDVIVFSNSPHTMSIDGELLDGGCSFRVKASQRSGDSKEEDEHQPPAVCRMS